MAARMARSMTLVAALLCGAARAEQVWVVRGGVKVVLGNREGIYFKPCRNAKVLLKSLVNVTYEASERGCPAQSFSGLSSDEPTPEERKAAEAEAKAQADELQALQSLTRPQ